MCLQAPSGAPAPKVGSFAQNLMNSQASQDAMQPIANSQPLTQSQLSMTAPSQPLTQTDLSQVCRVSLKFISVVPGAYEPHVWLICSW